MAARLAKIATRQLPMTTAKLMVPRAALPRLTVAIPTTVPTRLKRTPLLLVMTSRRAPRRPSSMMAMPVGAATRLMMTSAALPRLKVAMQRAAPTRLKLMSLTMVMSRRAPMRLSPMMAVSVEALARLVAERQKPTVVLAMEKLAPTGLKVLRLSLEARLGLWPAARLSLL